jgi:hypothetical protein
LKNDFLRKKYDSIKVKKNLLIAYGEEEEEEEK